MVSSRGAQKKERIGDIIIFFFKFTGSIPVGPCTRRRQRSEIADQTRCGMPVTLKAKARGRYGLVLATELLFLFLLHLCRLAASRH